MDAIFGYHSSLLRDLLLFLCIAIPLAKVAQLAALISGIVPFQGKRHTGLQALVNLLVRAPGSGTHMKIIVYSEHLYLQDLAIVLGLLNLRSGPTTLEEVWASWNPYHVGLKYMKENYEKRYENLVMSAAEQAGCCHDSNNITRYRLQHRAKNESCSPSFPTRRFNSRYIVLPISTLRPGPRISAQYPKHPYLLIRKVIMGLNPVSTVDINTQKPRSHCEPPCGKISEN